MNVLVLCTGNSCRSQMAEAYLQRAFGSEAKVYSAGIEAHGVNQYAVKVMAEDGIDISGNTSKTVTDISGITFDVVLTVCDHASEHCPVFAGAARRFHYSFPDPAKAIGSEESILSVFRAVRDNIKAFAYTFRDKLIK